MEYDYVKIEVVKDNRMKLVQSDTSQYSSEVEAWLKAFPDNP